MLGTMDTSTLRNHLADALREIKENRDFMLITKKSKPVSVLVNLDFFEDLLAMNSKEYLASIREARKQAKNGKLLSHSDVFGKL